eukprot:3976455-Pleurochrysis_carterae.AAC.2
MISCLRFHARPPLPPCPLRAVCARRQGRMLSTFPLGLSLSRQAINHSGYKNIVGLFHTPTMALIDTSFYETLGATELKSGLGELTKNAALFGGARAAPSPTQCARAAAHTAHSHPPHSCRPVPSMPDTYTKCRLLSVQHDGNCKRHHYPHRHHDHHRPPLLGCLTSLARACLQASTTS